ncbi:ArsR/SmtB family transcription factor [Halopseudomonas phragmitis]|uniref:ArsR family transcriptional regulator n=1 Tax=Halopseudomonas phragmitis TaxID=1931241 RepID=A0A1V0B417_9GAMM|nr:metalloregulator ArsR/SmtB family transcription factor [Halopseudomonas phragmitis]AQZ94534.1 ArsR family transcriptional regulator [Halopseudomonas phragmitis]
MTQHAQLVAHPGHTSPVDLLANFCKAASDSLRLDILRALRNDSFGVLELAQIFAVRQSGMSHHLKILANAGLVSTRREGNSIFYRRSLPQGDNHWRALHEQLLAGLDAVTLDPGLQAAIDTVHAQRAELSRQFFSRFNDGTPAQQDLIAHFGLYREPLLGLLDSLAADARTLAIEVGPGEGGFLPDLAARFERVIALDNAPSMLERASQHCREAGLANVDCLLADALTPQNLPLADCLVCNMVLHHMPAPAEALKRFASLIKPGGSLILTELCSHDQSWVRDSCGDLWLGFDQDDLSHWAQDAGLSAGASLYLGLRNGFQIQIQQFANHPPAEERILL